MVTLKKRAFPHAVCGARISPLNDHIIEIFVRFPRLVVRVRHVFDLLGYFPDFHVL